MADQDDVAGALVQIVSDAVYPNGVDQPSVGACPVIVYQGWPNPQTLDADLAAGKAHISVFPQPGDVVTAVMMGDTDWQEASNNGTTGIGAREVRRQTKQFQITVWTATPALRSMIAKPLDLTLALTSRIALPDGTQALLSYARQTARDEQQKLLIYRRDFFYAINFATLQTQPQYAIRQTIVNAAGGPSETITGTTVTRTNQAPNT